MLAPKRRVTLWFICGLFLQISIKIPHSSDVTLISLQKKNYPRCPGTLNHDFKFGCLVMSNHLPLVKMWFIIQLKQLLCKWMDGHQLHSRLPWRQLSHPNPNVSSGSQVSRPVPHSDSARIKATDRPIVFSRSMAHHPATADKWSFSKNYFWRQAIYKSM